MSWQFEWDDRGPLEDLRYLHPQAVYEFLILGDALITLRSGRSLPLQFLVMGSQEVVAHVAKPLVAGGDLLDDFGVLLEGAVYEFNTVPHRFYPFANVASSSGLPLAMLSARNEKIFVALLSLVTFSLAAIGSLLIGDVGSLARRTTPTYSE